MELLVIGIQHLGNVFGVDLLLDCAKIIAHVEFLEIETLRGLGAPQPEDVDRVDLVAGHRSVIRDTLDLLPWNPLDTGVARLVKGSGRVSTESDFHRKICFFKLPRITRLQPSITQLLLPPVLKGLVKHAELVANAVT